MQKVDFQSVEPRGLGAGDGLLPGAAEPPETVEQFQVRGSHLTHGDWTKTQAVSSIVDPVKASGWMPR